MQHCDKAEEAKSGLDPDPDPDPSETKPKKKPHNFSFSYNKTKYNVTCDASLSVLKGLQTNFFFKGICKKEQKGRTKEVVIQRAHMPHAAVAPHFPCCLINNNEILTIRFIKPSDGSSSTAWTPELAAHTPETLVCFYIRTKGEENIRKPMKNNQLQRALDYVCVYAARGEEVKAALKRDGRFNVKMFSRGALRDEKTEIITDLSNLVDYLGGKQFVIVFCQHQTDSQELSQESVGTVKEEKRPVPQEEKPEGASSNAQEKKRSTKSPKEEVKCREYPKVQQIPDTQEILKLLREQHEELLKVLEERKLNTPAKLKRFYREEYDKYAQSFSEVKTLKTLMEISDSVCQIRGNDDPIGSGFVLFHRFVLTNAHVVENYLKTPSELKAAFHFEDLTSVGIVMAVEKVVAYQKGNDYMGNYVDFALLELGGNDKVPTGFLQRYSAPPARGGLCIIGHPGGGVKRMDPCYIISKEDVPLAAHEHFQKYPNPAGFNIVLLQSLIEENLQSKIYYDTCFFHGSSGSPLFDDRCHLIGVHTGGYLYNGKGKKTRSVMEWGLPIFPIMVQIYIQCREQPEVVQHLESLNNLKYVVQEAKKQLTANHNHPDPGDIPESMDTTK